MKKTMVKKIVSILIIGLFMISFAGTAISSETQETTKIKGTIASIDAGTGKVEVIDESGKMVNLKAGPEADIKKVSAKDKVTVEFDSNMVIKSITK